MKNEKGNLITNYISAKEYLLLFILLAAFNGFHMWIYQTFVNNGMMETHIRTVINLLILYLVVTTVIITSTIGFARRFLLTGPLKELSDAAQKIAKGDLSVRVVSRIKSKKLNFIAVLFDDFNTMTEELASANEKLKALSTTDELTKLDNRRSFLEYMDIIWKQSHRLQLPITVLMIDIDYFKKYNDSLGHLEGDKTLVAIAQCMRNQLKRETDFVARFGGEEFVCLLPYIDKADAANFANDLVKSVEDMKIPHPMSEHSQYVTISAGMASLLPDNHNSHTQLLNEADKALYRAKETGRNRVVVY